MKKVIFGIAIVATLLCFVWTTAQACGDKLLMLGRGIRFQSGYAPRPATILLYAPTGFPSAAALTDLKFQSALKEAGHTLRTVGNKTELEETLKAAKYDMVISEVAFAMEVEEAAGHASHRPVFLPFAYEPTKTELAALKKQYNKIVLWIPAKAGYYCAIVDKALESKRKTTSR